MKRVNYSPYIFLALLLITALSLPTTCTQMLRYSAAAAVAPSWASLSAFKQTVLAAVALPTLSGPVPRAPLSEELERLKRENLLLRQQVEQVRGWLCFDEQIRAQLAQLHLLREQDSPFLQKRGAELYNLLKEQLQALPAKVVLREPAFWSSTLWIGVGERDNQAMGRAIIAKNSPVVVGAALVGIVEEVGPRLSRVRLLTDSRFIPAVQIFHGEKIAFRGELYGDSTPLWRGRIPLLRGVGCLEEGPLQPADLLVTSGLDGLFPAGLEVAYIASLQSPTEFTARPAAPDLGHLITVFVLPSLQ